jgi:hypothetical protein
MFSNKTVEKQRKSGISGDVGTKMLPYHLSPESPFHVELCASRGKKKMTEKFFPGVAQVHRALFLPYGDSMWLTII